LQAGNVRETSLESRLKGLQNQLMEAMRVKSAAQQNASQAVHEVEVARSDKEHACREKERALQAMSQETAEKKLIGLRLHTAKKELDEAKRTIEEQRREMLELRRSYQAALKFGHLMEQEKATAESEATEYKKKITVAETREARSRAESALKIAELNERLLQMIKENDYLRGVLGEKEGEEAGGGAQGGWEDPD
jgi:hypothetical protein